MFFKMVVSAPRVEDDKKKQVKKFIYFKNSSLNCNYSSMCVSIFTTVTAS